MRFIEAVSAVMKILYENSMSSLLYAYRTIHFQCASREIKTYHVLLPLNYFVSFFIHYHSFVDKSCTF